MPIMLFYVYPAAVLQACFLPPAPARSETTEQAPRPLDLSDSFSASRRA